MQVFLLIRINYIIINMLQQFVWLDIRNPFHVLPYWFCKEWQSNQSKNASKATLKQLYIKNVNCLDPRFKFVNKLSHFRFINNVIFLKNSTVCQAVFIFFTRFDIKKLIFCKKFLKLYYTVNFYFIFTILMFNLSHSKIEKFHILTFIYNLLT